MMLFKYYDMPFRIDPNQSIEKNELIIYDEVENNVEYVGKTYTISKKLIEEIKDIIDKSNVLSIDNDDVFDEHVEGMDSCGPVLMDGKDYYFNFCGQKEFSVDNIHYYLEYINDLPAHKAIVNTTIKIMELLKEEGIEIDCILEWWDKEE